MIEPCEEVKRVEQRYEKALDDMEKHYKDVLDKIRAEMQATAEMHEDGDYYLRDEWIDEYFDKYTKGV